MLLVWNNASRCADVIDDATSPPRRHFAARFTREIKLHEALRIAINQR